MTTEQIIKALKVCTNGQSCKKCPCEDGILCIDNLMQEALSLITSQEQKIKELAEENERMSGKVAEYEEERKYHFEMSRKRIAEAKADTVREMLERLKKRLDGNGWDIAVAYAQKIVDQIAKEMVEEK